MRRRTRGDRHLSNDLMVKKWPRITCAPRTYAYPVLLRQPIASMIVKSERTHGDILVRDKDESIRPRITGVHGPLSHLRNQRNLRLSGYSQKGHKQGAQEARDKSHDGLDTY